MKTIIIKKSQSIPSGSMVEGSSIEAKYPLSHLAVELVRDYDEASLYLVGTIADLPTGGPYGLYSTGENVHVLPQEIADKVRLVFNTNNINLVPKVSLLQTIPGISESNIQVGDTIRVNINRILTESHHENPLIFHFNVIKGIAVTIYHEATHVSDTEQTGQTTESSAEQAETPFSQYIDSNFDRIAERIKTEAGLSDEDIASYVQDSDVNK